MPTAADLRAAFAGFADEALFADATITFWLGFADQMCDPVRWGTLRDHGQMLLAAHHLTLDAAARKSKDGTGGMEAAAGGVISETKTVGGVSRAISRAGTAAAADPSAGAYNDTSYGKQYAALAKSIGAGGMVV